MAKDDIDLLEANEIAFRLELTPPELKLTYSALTALLNDLGHDEYDVQRIIRLVLNKLPPPERSSRSTSASHAGDRGSERVRSARERGVGDPRRGRAGTGDRRLGRDLHHPEAAR